MKGGKLNEKADNKLRVKKSVSKDPNKPKRPASPFFVFMEDYRKQYKEEHPENKSVIVVGKASGDKWKHLTDVEKAPYIAEAEKRKNEYKKLMDAYNKKQAGEVEDELDEENGNESNKSKSEVDEENGNEFNKLMSEVDEENGNLEV